MTTNPSSFTLAEAGVRLIAFMAIGGIPLLSLATEDPIAAEALLAPLLIVMAPVRLDTNNVVAP
jgi:hypothetical protein